MQEQGTDEGGRETKLHRSGVDTDVASASAPPRSPGQDQQKAEMMRDMRVELDRLLRDATALQRQLAENVATEGEATSSRPIQQRVLHRAMPTMRRLPADYAASATSSGMASAEPPAPVSYTHLRAHET